MIKLKDLLNETKINKNIEFMKKPKWIKFLKNFKVRLDVKNININSDELKNLARKYKLKIKFSGFLSRGEILVKGDIINIHKFWMKVSGDVAQRVASDIVSGNTSDTSVEFDNRGWKIV